MKKQFIIILILISCGVNINLLCQNEKTKITDTIKLKDIRGIIDSILEIQNIELLNYNSIVRLDTLYVIDRAGAFLFQNPDSNSNKIGIYDYGDEVEVIEIDNSWIGLPERVHRIFIINGKKHETWRWEKAFINRASLGELNEIKLIAEDLYEMDCLYDTINQNNFGFTNQLDKNIKIEDFISIELINKSLFETKQKTAINFLISDTNKVKKKNDILFLKCDEMKLKLKDDQNGDTGKTYYYVGRMDVINQYIIYRSYWEYYDFQFIDMNTCNITNTFQDFPYISPDKKYIISIYPDVYSGHILLELFKIDGGEINLIVGACFTNWLAFTEKNDRFWADDGFFYAKVNHLKYYMGHYSDDKDYQYIRIKIKS